MKRAGKRFGFVRFSNFVDAERAIERLEGFRLYGFRLSKQEVGAKDINQSKPKVAEENTYSTSFRQMNQSGEIELKRVEGFIEEEALIKLNKCAVGTMATVCNISSVENRLQNWGFGELSIKSMGGSRFLIEFKDQDLFHFLKEQNWSYLLEVFTEVEPWTEAFHLPERITWIEVEGIPLHCWNQITFNRIAGIWGNLIALGENDNQSLGVDKITILVSTSERNNLDGVLELEAGRECFLVRVKELGFNFHSTFKSNDVSDKEVSSSEKKTKPSPTNLGDSINLGGDDSINVLSTDDYRQLQAGNNVILLEEENRADILGKNNNNFGAHDKEEPVVQIKPQEESNDVYLTWAEKVDTLNSLQPTQEEKSDRPQFSNKALSTAERKKRDRAQRKIGSTENYQIWKVGLSLILTFILGSSGFIGWIILNLEYKHFQSGSKFNLENVISLEGRLVAILLLAMWLNRGVFGEVVSTLGILVRRSFISSTEDCWRRKFGHWQSMQLHLGDEENSVIENCKSVLTEQAFLIIVGTINLAGAGCGGSLR
ncbi:hypothetical protein GQ457_12G002800 [Hibiscus cannabinus]